jgi:anti-anti-sigma regulatory factor
MEVTMLDFFKNTSDIEPINVEDKYLTSSQVAIEIDGLKIGGLQEFIITENRKSDEIIIDLRRLYYVDDSLSDYIGDNDSNLIIKVTESRINHDIEDVMNDCRLDRVSRIYSAEDYITNEDLSFSTKVWSKTIRKK